MEEKEANNCVTKRPEMMWWTRLFERKPSKNFSIKESHRVFFVDSVSKKIMKNYENTVGYN